jgi:peroxiredoxin
MRPANWTTVSWSIRRAMVGLLLVLGVSAGQAAFANEPAAPTLAQQLQQQRERSAQKIPVETRRTMQQKTEELARSGLIEKSLKVGDKAPDFKLLNTAGKAVRLNDLLQHGPVVVAFYRGGWCPYCNLELRALQQRLPEIEKLGAQLIAISPQTPDSSLSTQQKDELQFQVLSDRGNSVARKFGLVFTLPPEIRAIYKGFGHDLVARNGDDSYELPVPATYVIDRDRTIHFGFANADYTKRAEPSDILAALRQLQRR